MQFVDRCGSCRHAIEFNRIYNIYAFYIWFNEKTTDNLDQFLNTYTIWNAAFLYTHAYNTLFCDWLIQ